MPQVAPRDYRFMLLHVLICLAVLSASSAPTMAAPYVPEHDSEILERLPFAPGDPVPHVVRLAVARGRRPAPPSRS